MKSYVLIAVAYIPYESDPFKEERIRELKRIEQLYQTLRTSCHEYKSYRDGLFGLKTVFKKCSIDLLPEKGDLYELREN